MKRLIAMLALLAFAVPVAAPALADPDPYWPIKERVCYVFNPLLDNDLDGSLFDPPAWRAKTIPLSALDSYRKTRAGLHIQQPGATCPPFVAVMWVMR
jgi:hypothetical protein